MGAITIGDNVKIGGGSVVLKSVPPSCTVVGVPGRIVVRNGARVTDGKMEVDLEYLDVEKGISVRKTSFLVLVVPEKRKPSNWRGWFAENN